MKNRWVYPAITLFVGMVLGARLDRLIVGKPAEESLDIWAEANHVAALAFTMQSNAVYAQEWMPDLAEAYWVASDKIWRIALAIRLEDQRNEYEKPVAERMADARADLAK